MAKNNKVGIIDGGNDCKNKIVKRLLFKNLNRGTSYLILNARQTFTQLSQAFTKFLTFWQFNLECHIWIENNASSYAISRILN